MLLIIFHRNPRYNARDATWWFLQAIQDYCTVSQDVSILRETVIRLFPYDDQNEYYSKKSQLSANPGILPLLLPSLPSLPYVFC